MAIIGLRIVSGQQLTNASAAYGTAVGTSRRQRIDKVTVCNTTGTARYFTMYLVPSGGSADTTNVVVYQKSVQPSETYSAGKEVVGHWMEAGGQIYALAEASSALTFMVSGIEES